MECNSLKVIECKEVKIVDINDLLRLKNIMYEHLDTEILPDLSSVFIDTSIPIYERMQIHCDAIKNPYILKAGKTLVKIEFSQEQDTIENKVKDYLKSAKFQ